MSKYNSYPDLYQSENEIMGAAAGNTRKRIPQSSSLPTHTNQAGIYEELETLRHLVDEIEERPSCNKGTIDGNLMSTVFGIVLVMILSMSIYAFTNLYRAVVRRFYNDS